MELPTDVIRDLEIIRDAVRPAVAHHQHRNRADAELLHLAPEVRWSPMTSNLMEALDRLDRLLNPVQFASANTEPPTSELEEAIEAASRTVPWDSGAEPLDLERGPGMNAG